MTSLDQSSLIRQLLSEASDEKSIEYAIKAYREGKISLGIAVEMAGTTTWRFLDELRKQNVMFDYDLVDAKNEIDAVEKGMYKKFIKQE